MIRKIFAQWLMAIAMRLDGPGIFDVVYAVHLALNEKEK